MSCEKIIRHSYSSLSLTLLLGHVCESEREGKKTNHRPVTFRKVRLTCFGYLQDVNKNQFGQS